MGLLCASGMGLVSQRNNVVPCTFHELRQLRLLRLIIMKAGAYLNTAKQQHEDDTGPAERLSDAQVATVIRDHETRHVSMVRHGELRTAKKLSVRTLAFAAERESWRDTLSARRARRGSAGPRHATT